MTRKASDPPTAQPASPPDVRRGAQTVHRAIAILESFTIDRPSLSLVQICEAVQLTLPTTHRLLKALQHKDMVTCDPLSKRYSLGIGVMRLASLILNRDDLNRIIVPWLEFLRGETRETVALHGVIDNRRVCLMEMVSALPIRMASGVGTAYPLIRGAAGKAILAWMPPERIADVLDAAVEAGELSEQRRPELSKELEAIRATGFATSRGETVSRAAALAAPILNAKGAIVGAINITGPADRLTPERVREFAPRLMDVSANVMRQLGVESLPRPEKPVERVGTAASAGRKGSQPPPGPDHPVAPHPSLVSQALSDFGGDTVLLT